LQKWSKGKQQDKLNNSVIFDKSTSEKLLKELPKMKFFTPAIVSERFRITVSLARQAIKELENEKRVRRVGTFHHAQYLYVRCENEKQE
jgi:small subunit ribosomal protein S25e